MPLTHSWLLSPALYAHFCHVCVHVHDPWPHPLLPTDSHWFSQLRFDLLTSGKLSDAFSIGLEARGRLNRLAGEIELIRMADGYDWVTLGSCTAAHDGRVMLIGCRLCRQTWDGKKTAHVYCYRQSLQCDQHYRASLSMKNTHARASQIKYHNDRQMLGQISMLHNCIDWFRSNLLGALFHKPSWVL